MNKILALFTAVFVALVLAVLVVIAENQREEYEKYTVIEAALSPVEGEFVHHIPPGSLIYHAGNITTVYAPDGKIILKARRSDAAMAPTGHSEVPATSVSVVPSGSYSIREPIEFYTNDKGWITGNATKTYTADGRLILITTGEKIKYRPGEILVWFKKDLKEDVINEINSRYNTSGNFMLPPNVFILDVPPDKAEEEIIKLYADLTEVEYVEPRSIGHFHAVGNETGYVQNEIFISCRKRTPTPKDTYVPDEFIVMFKANVSEETINEINSKYGTSVKETSPFVREVKVLSIPPNKTVEEMVRIYSNLSEVEFAELVSIGHGCMVPNDPIYSYQWHLENDAYGGINMESAWDTSTGNGVVVAVLDTGVAYEDYDIYCQATDLAGTTFVQGYDYVNGDWHPDDDHGHGTHIAGTIAQTTNNDYGVAGVAFGCSIMPVKVMNCSGDWKPQNFFSGVHYAVNNGADIICFAGGRNTPHTLVEAAVEYAYNNGVTVIAAAGNQYEEGNPTQYPAAYDDYVIAVGATRYDETRAYYSNTGSCLDLVAPGGDITVDQNDDEYNDGVLQETFSGGHPCDFGFSFWEGTSMATAHVAGVAALLIANGVTGPDNIRDRLQSTAEDRGAPGWDEEYGWGLVDAASALNPHLVAFPESYHRYNNVGSPTYLTGSRPHDPDGYITEYRWNYGDGAIGYGEDVEHTYPTYNWIGDAGGYYEPFDVSLRVKDNDENTDTENIDVNVYIAGDGNGDGETNILDIVPVGVRWGKTCDRDEPYLWSDAYSDHADVNNDCDVNIIDASIIGVNWNHDAWGKARGYRDNPSINVSLPGDGLSSGDTFTVNIVIDPMDEEVYGVQYNLLFNTSILNATSQTNETFLSHDGAQTLLAANNIDNAIGITEYGESRIAVENGTTDPGILSSVVFEVTESSDMINLTLDRIVLGDPEAQSIPLENVSIELQFLSWLRYSSRIDNRTEYLGVGGDRSGFRR